MRYDLSPTSLPFLNKTFLPTDGPNVTQVAQWGDIITALEYLQDKCVTAPLRLPGWASLGEIVVAFWPEKSIIDMTYRLNQKTKGGGDGELKIRDEYEDEE